MKQVTQASLGALTIALFSSFAHADSVGVIVYDSPATTASTMVVDSVSSGNIAPLSFTATTLAPADIQSYTSAPTTDYSVDAVAPVVDPLIPETLGAALFGGSEPVVYIAPAGESRASTVAAVEAIDAATPLEGGRLDMSGRDGSLRACYAAGGIAKQHDDLSYFCTYDSASTGKGVGAVTAESSRFIAPVGADTGYDGTTNVHDEALMDCMERGGSLIQLASNEAFACAM